MGCLTIFLHIPKTGGSSLRQVIRRHYHPTSIYSIYQYSEKRLRQLQNLSEERREEINLLEGHFNLGYHQFFNQPYSYITMLRDPVERIISLYYFILNTRGWVYDEIMSRNMELEEFVRSGIDPTVENHQTRMLASIDYNNVPFGQSSIDILQKAKHNLQSHFSVVRLTERFDESLLLLRGLLVG